MQSLTSIALTLQRTPTSPVPPTLTSTGGLFEREVERAAERDGGERALETRAASQIQERRSARQASFERVREGETPARREEHEHDPVQALADPPRPAPAPAEPSVSREASAGSDTTTEPATGGADPAKQAAAPGALPAQAPSSAPAAPPTAVAGTPGAGVAAVLAAGAEPAPAGSAQPADGTAAFLQGARGGRGAAAGTSAPQAGEAPDAALIDRAAEVLRQIKLSLSPSARRIVVDLQPDELGRLSIRMGLRDGRVSAVVRAESPKTLELLERHLPELRAVLADRGIETGSLELELGFGNAAHGGRQESAAARRALRPNGTRTLVVSAIDAESAAPATWTPSVEGGVDTYA